MVKFMKNVKISLTQEVRLKSYFRNVSQIELLIIGTT